VCDACVSVSNCACVCVNACASGFGYTKKRPSLLFLFLFKEWARFLSLEFHKSPFKGESHNFLRPRDPKIRGGIPALSVCDRCQLH